jgi:hypothetical protein
MAIDYQRANKVLELVREHGALQRACRELKIARETFIRWTEQDEKLALEYARAKAEGIDKLVEDTIDLADEAPPMTAAGNVDSGAIAHAKLRIETRRWFAERLAPRKYGVLQKLEHTGADGGPIKQSVVIATGVPDAGDHSDLA